MEDFSYIEDNFFFTLPILTFFQGDRRHFPTIVQNLPRGSEKNWAQGKQNKDFIPLFITHA